MANIVTRLFTALHGTSVGTDEFGNRYYISRKNGPSGRKRRWVVYKGEAEATKVPPYWHSWLHYTLENPPTDADRKRYDWQLPWQPNQTGTPNRHLPQGHLLRGGQHAPSMSGDYEAWEP